MTRKEYLREMLHRGFIQYECVGSEGTKDCVSFKSDDVFYKKNSFCLYINKYVWDDIEGILSEYLNEAIENGDVELKYDVVAIEVTDLTPNYSLVDLIERGKIILKDYELKTHDTIDEDYAVFNRTNNHLYCYPTGNECLFYNEDDVYDYLLKKYVKYSVTDYYKDEEKLYHKIIKDKDGDRYYLDITDDTKLIFGDAVEKVEMEIATDYGMEPEELKKDLYESACKIISDLKLKPQVVDLEETLYLTFKNGNRICLWNSEWASIGLCKQ